MRRWTFILLGVVLLGACNTASPAFRGLPATRMSVQGSTFDVRVKGNSAEAIRVNSQYAPRTGPIHARAAFAMTQVSGCRVKAISGDQALATGRLDCGDRPTGWTAPPAPTSFSCVAIRQWLTPDQNGLYAEFDCDPYGG